MSDHNEVVERISKHFEKKGFQVQTRENNLPTGGGRNDALYRPDIIVRNREDQIVWLVEVETSEGGKAVAGAAILADICMEKMNVKGRPKLLFVFYRPESNLKLAEKRLSAMESRIKHLDMKRPVSETAALKQISEFSGVLM
jgi:hypothetical protein